MKVLDSAAKVRETLHVSVILQPEIWNFIYLKMREISVSVLLSLHLIFHGVFHLILYYWGVMSSTYIHIGPLKGI